MIFAESLEEYHSYEDMSDVRMSASLCDEIYRDMKAPREVAFDSGDLSAVAFEGLLLADVCLMYDERSTFDLDEYGQRQYHDDTTGELDRRVDNFVGLSEVFFDFGIPDGLTGRSPALASFVRETRDTIYMELNRGPDFEKITNLLELIASLLEAEAQRLIEEADAENAPADDPRRLRAASYLATCGDIRSTIRSTATPKRPRLPRCYRHSHSPTPRHVRPATPPHAPPVDRPTRSKRVPVLE